MTAKYFFHPWRWPIGPTRKRPVEDKAVSHRDPAWTQHIGDICEALL